MPRDLDAEAIEPAALTETDRLLQRALEDEKNGECLVDARSAHQEAPAEQAFGRLLVKRRFNAIDP